MTANTRRSTVRRVSWGVVASAVLAASTFALNSAVHAQAQGAGANEHWVGTWSTAVVARLQAGAQGAGRGQAPQQGQAPAAAPGQAQAPQGQAAAGGGRAAAP